MVGLEVTSGMFRVSGFVGLTVCRPTDHVTDHGQDSFVVLICLPTILEILLPIELTSGFA